MGKRKPGLTLEEHERLGKDLRALREWLGGVMVQLSVAYPHKVADRAHKAQEGIDSLRSLLDDLIHHERPGQGVMRVYYGANNAALRWARGRFPR